MIHPVAGLIARLEKLMDELDDLDAKLKKEQENKKHLAEALEGLMDHCAGDIDGEHLTAYNTSEALLKKYREAA